MSFTSKGWCEVQILCRMIKTSGCSGLNVTYWFPSALTGLVGIDGMSAGRRLPQQLSTAPISIPTSLNRVQASFLKENLEILNTRTIHVQGSSHMLRLRVRVGQCRAPPGLTRVPAPTANAAHSRVLPYPVRGLADAAVAQRQRASLMSLKRDAREAPGDPERQVRLLRKLEEEEGADAVVAHVEALPNSRLSEAVLREYLRALAGKATGRAGGAKEREDRAGALDPVHMRTASASGFLTQQFAGAGVPPVGRGGPQMVHVAMAEPSSKEQVWRTLRMLAGAYLLLLGITTIMEERGLVKGISSGGEMGSTKAAESTKTFKDVVGVDEAKAELEEIVAFLRQPEKFTRLGGKMTKGELLRASNLCAACSVRCFSSLRRRGWQARITIAGCAR